MSTGLSNSNKLTNEKSPYLLQHATNPVDWYPWGNDAFEKARLENKPIFLSIGYSTCHWCHVMAHESFKDQEVADLMNETFVSIKVDREERPDIDKIYMTVCQMMTGSGGWPLTILMTPDKKPFFAGTYFPKKTRFGRLGLVDLIKRIKELWKNQRNNLLNSADQVNFSLNNVDQESLGEQINENTLIKTYEILSRQFDEKNGGFGSHPKFPTPQNLIFLLRYWKRSGEEKALQMVETTLQSMRKGGIYDQIGFGFHRYSTDSNWLVPHFEKMLYDQALLTIVYTEAFQATKKVEYKKTAEEILTYVLRDMLSPEGGFYSAEDADSEGEEGKFYIWSKDSLTSILDENELNIAIKTFNINESGNYQDEATRKKTGNNILYLQIFPNQKLQEKIERIRSKLYKEREKRVHPFKDGKILTDWNGLMITALVKASVAFQEKKYLIAAKKAVEFVFSTLREKNGRLYHRYKDGISEIPGFLADYSFFIWALIELYEATFNVFYLKSALELHQAQLDHFWDKEIGGFYFNADDSEQLLTRPKEIYDGAIPSGNSIALLNLLRLSYLTGDPVLEKKADLLSRAFAEKIRANPLAYTQFLVAIDFAVGPTFSLVIAGDTEAKDTIKLINLVFNEYIPNKVFIHRRTEENPPDIDEYSNFVQFFVKDEGKATAYICFNKTCKPPTQSIQKISEYLNGKWT